MSISLQKGQKIDLTKTTPGLSKIMVGLGWDPVQRKNEGGFLKSLFSAPPAEIDCDASVLLCDSNGKLTDREDVVYFGHLIHRSESVKHMGDNLTGDGAGDDEQIFINLNEVPSTYDKAVFVVNIYQSAQRKQHFGMIENAFIRLVNIDTGVELCRFNLSDDYNNQTAMIMGEIYRHEGDWKFSAIGTGTTDPSLTELVKRYS